MKTKIKRVMAGVAVGAILGGCVTDSGNSESEFDKPVAVGQSAGTNASAYAAAPIVAKPAGELVEPPTVGVSTNKQARASATIQYINHLNYVVAKLGNMNDLLVLQQEYENLTDDNLNMEVIPDEITMQTILALMEEVKNLQVANIRSVQAQLIFEQEKRDAIWKALPNPSVFVVSGSDPATIATTLGTTVAMAAWTSVQNYYNAKAEASKEVKEKEFEIAKDKLNYINEINKELFEAQWRLMHEYGISDRERVTRAEVRLFLDFAEVLDDQNAKDYDSNKLVFDVFKAHEKEMKNLPFYWMTRAAAAQANENAADVLYSCREYFELYRSAPIVRRDMDACSMALLYVSTAMKENPKLAEQNKEWVCRWLEFVMDTVRIPQWETKFSVAMIYRSLGEDARAKEILKTTFSEVYACVKVWERSCAKKDGEEKAKPKNIFRKTPALEKAYADTEFGKTWGGWEKEAQKLVPYDGYVWLGGALYDMGEKDIFANHSCDRSRCGVSMDLIEGSYKNKTPRIERRGNELRIYSNGLWENAVKEGDDLRISADGIPCAWDDEAKCFRARELKFVLRVSVLTKRGVSLRYEYSANDLSKPVKKEIVFPWTLSRTSSNRTVK